MFLDLDVQVYSSISRFGTTWFKCGCWHESLVSILQVAVTLLAWFTVPQPEKKIWLRQLWLTLNFLPIPVFFTSPLLKINCRSQKITVGGECLGLPHTGLWPWFILFHKPYLSNYILCGLWVCNYWEPTIWFVLSWRTSAVVDTSFHSNPSTISLFILMSVKTTTYFVTCFWLCWFSLVRKHKLDPWKQP